MSLKQQTLAGFIWTFVDVFLIKSLLFGATILIARWIGPSEFGLVGMIAIFIALGKTLTDSGMTNSLIRLKDATNEDYSTVFFTNLGMSILLYLILFICSPFIAAFFHQGVLIEVLRVYGLIFILVAFSSVQVAILSKEMNFRKITVIGLPSILIGVGIGLWLAYLDYGVWSIVWMYISTEFTRTLLLWFFSNWRVSVVFSLEKFKSHFGFGSRLLLSGIVDTVFKNIYNIIIGRVFMPQTLGYFERSRDFATYPSGTLTAILMRVTYPMMAQLQDDPIRLAGIYRKLMRVSFFFISPLMFMLVALAEPIFNLVLGDEWMPAVPFFQVLCLAMMLYPIHSFNLDVLKVYGRSDLFLRLELVKKGILVITLLIGFQFGIMGVIWSSVFSSFISLLINARYSSRFIRYTVFEQVFDLGKIMFLAGVMWAVMYYTRDQLEGTSTVFQLLMTSMIGVMSYLGLNFLYKDGPLYQTIELVKNRNK